MRVDPGFSTETVLKLSKSRENEGAKIVKIPPCSERHSIGLAFLFGGLHSKVNLTSGFRFGRISGDWLGLFV